MVKCYYVATAKSDLFPGVTIGATHIEVSSDRSYQKLTKEIKDWVEKGYKVEIHVEEVMEG